jgi:hypothetical protein
MKNFDGPIPGENYTSDTKNYPWHRPPEFTDLDEAIEYIGKRLTNEDNAVGFLTMAQNGVSILDLTMMFLTSGMGAGKWTLDYALLLAGPTAHILRTVIKAYGIPVNMGFKVDGMESAPPSKEFFGAVKEINMAKAKVAGRTGADQIDDIQEHTAKMMKTGDIVQPKKRGFIGANELEPSQDEMLGHGSEAPMDMEGMM